MRCNAITTSCQDESDRALLTGVLVDMMVQPDSSPSDNERLCPALFYRSDPGVIGSTLQPLPFTNFVLAGVLMSRHSEEATIMMMAFVCLWVFSYFGSVTEVQNNYYDTALDSGEPWSCRSVFEKREPRTSQSDQWVLTLARCR